MGGGSKKGGGTQLPKPPKLQKSYGQGVNLNLQYLPQQLSSEQGFRNQYDPTRVAAQQALQAKYGPTQYAQMADAVNRLDPNFVSTRNQLANTVQTQLKAGSSLTPDQVQQVQQYYRQGAEARGNDLGGAANAAESYALGDRGQQMLQQRVQNAGNFLQSPNIVQLAAGTPPVSADRSFAYVNPNAGFQGIDAANQAYQSLVGASAANQSGGGNSWGSTIQTIGQIAGMVAMFASDKRLKKDIVKVGEGPKGTGIYEFSYKGDRPPRYRGVMAQEVEKKFPGSVVTDPSTGMKAVDYYKVGVPFERVG